MYFGGVNGRSCLGVATSGDEPDPLGEWFRRTRPSEEFPAWLHNACVADPDEDRPIDGSWASPAMTLTLARVCEVNVRVSPHVPPGSAGAIDSRR